MEKEPYKLRATDFIPIVGIFTNSARRVGKIDGLKLKDVAKYQIVTYATLVPYHAAWSCFVYKGLEALLQ